MRTENSSAETRSRARARGLAKTLGAHHQSDISVDEAIYVHKFIIGKGPEIQVKICSRRRAERITGDIKEHGTNDR
jgi:hypothetical protein